MSFICFSRFDNFFLTRALLLSWLGKLFICAAVSVIMKFVFEVKNEYIYIVVMYELHNYTVSLDWDPHTSI